MGVMTTTLVLPGNLAAELLRIAQLEIETGAVLLARLVDVSNGDIRLLGRELLLVPEDAYQVREADVLKISSDGYVPFLHYAEDASCVPIWLHTHVGKDASPRPSMLDEEVDNQLSDLFRLRTGSDYYGSLIVSHMNGILRFTGFLENDKGRRNLDRLFSVGSRFSLVRSDYEKQKEIAPIYDRNIRAFGGEIQAVLHDLKIAIIGCGGTGSAMVEQLARLGVRNFVLVDPDYLSDSNITRVYGSASDDVGRAKVEIAAENVMKIAPDAHVDQLLSTITVEGAVKNLVGVDLIFGCTDDNAGRLILSRFAYFMITPVIDCGVILTSGSENLIRGIDGRITLMYPGTACLVCRDRIDISRASAEMLKPEERIRLADEGYAPALPDVEPAVVSYTTIISAMAISELLERLVHYGPDTVPSEILIRLHEREMSGNQCPPQEKHYCHPRTGKIGLGLTDPFLEMAWTT